MKKDLLIYFVNRTFSMTEPDYSNSFFENCVNVWYKALEKDTDYDLLIMELFDILTNRFTAELLLKNYQSEITSHHNTYFIFNSLYDIDPKLQRAFFFLTQLLRANQIKIYILSLNPYSDISYYFNRDKGISKISHGGICLEDIHDFPRYTRQKHTKYNERLFSFAMDLRRGEPPVTYAKIREVTGIPKGTLCSHAKKKGIKLPGETGRNFLTEKEQQQLDEIFSILHREKWDFL